MPILSDDEFIQLRDFTKLNYGIDLSEKRTMLEGRIQSLLVTRGYGQFQPYFQSLLKDKTGREAADLMNKLSTNYTFFMREEGHFNFFRETVLPYLSVSVKDRDLRIWSAGCSSGEEPYTLAMIMSDYFGSNRLVWDKKILATDISSQVLEMALMASYVDEQIKDLPAHWKRQYFQQIEPDLWSLVKSIRNEVIFRKFNLMERIFPFKKKFHVIFCRNVMIYFDNETKRQLVNRMYDATAEGGYLFIGHAESLNRKETKYRYIQPAVYRKE